jgi:riboflavin-specific deaminase-like protein
LRVFSNLAITVDGKIADRKKPRLPLGTPADRRLMQVIRKKADVIVVGAGTYAMMKGPAKVKGAKLQPVNVVISASGALRPNAAFWRDPTVIRYVFTTSAGYVRALKVCGDRAFVVVLGKREIAPRAVLDYLSRFGYKNFLVEGGGSLMHSFLKANCLDEIYVTLTPWLMGGRFNPSLVDSEQALPRWKALRLISMKRLGNEVYFKYLVAKKR